MLALAVALASPAAPVDQSISGALVINPAGLFVRYDAGLPVGDGFKLGLFSNWQVFGNAFGVQLRWETDPAWFETHLEASADPGFYLKLPGARVQQGLTPGADAGDRTFGWRYTATWQTNLNIRTDQWWFYSRTTLQARQRDFVAADVFQKIQIEDDRSIEQATAIMFRLTDWGTGRLWAYGEYTVGGVLDIGTQPNRPSAGVILEGWPARGTTLNLDGFYSFAPGELTGPGLIAAWWHHW